MCRSFELNRRHLWLMVLAFTAGMPSTALAQFHGLGAQKVCSNPKLVGQTTDCQIQAINSLDQFNDTIQVNGIFDVVQAAPSPVRVPAAGNLPIVTVGGGATCAAGPVFPCTLPPGGSVIVRSNAYPIDANDPTPLPDQATIAWQDLCNGTPDVGCSMLPNIAQAVAQTIVVQCVTAADCGADPGVCGDNTCVNNVCGVAYSPASTECRPSAGACDIAESCTGSSAACPADAFASAATQCRASAGVCDVAESCTGNSAACPNDAFAPAATECRASAGICDVAESCTGSSAVCPGDVLAPATTECRASAGTCDVAENCTGSSVACPDDVLAPATTECRASAGTCDVAENCTGSSAACPGDVLAPATTECRASAGVCDVAESCTGTSAACPEDAFQPVSTPCSGELCQACTGNTASCPSVNLCIPEVCRTPGFWATHAGVEKPSSINITSELIQGALGGVISICGQPIHAYLGSGNTGVNHNDSPIEALCMRNAGDLRSQVIFHLTATALNCLANDHLGDCSNDPLFGTAFAACNTGAACATTTEANKDVQVACVATLDCLNNGGHPSMDTDGKFFCSTGTCSDNDQACTASDKRLCANPETAVCNPASNCHELDLPDYSKPGPAGSPQACNAAAMTTCDIFAASCP